MSYIFKTPITIPEETKNCIMAVWEKNLHPDIFIKVERTESGMCDVMLHYDNAADLFTIGYLTGVYAESMNQETID